MERSAAVSVSEHVQSPFMGAQHRVADPRSLVWLALRCIVGAVFVYAGVLKTWDPLAFANDIEHFRMISWGAGMRSALYLPWLEILCGLAVITGWLRAGALVILNGLVAVFIIATIAARMRGINLDCGCFGHASKGLGFGAHLAIDFALLALLAILWLRERKIGAAHNSLH